MKAKGEVAYDGSFTCPKLVCGNRLCANCRASHGDIPCEVYQMMDPDDRLDKGEQQLIACAKTEGYSRCEKCKSYVELKEGCNHITCRCTYDYCHVCGLRWKTCHCPVWDEAKIDREARNRAGPRANIEQINLVAAGIRNEAADCGGNDHSWQRRDSYGGNCRNCAFTMYAYYHRCTRCDFRACYTCVHHRLT